MAFRRTLAQAHHADELPLPCRSVVRIYGAMRGVGGIDSWGSNVEEAYRVPSEKDILCAFRMIL